jgi:hypothetical protein
VVGEVSTNPGVDGPRLEVGGPGHLRNGPTASDQQDGLEPPEGPDIWARLDRAGEAALIVPVEAQDGRVRGVLMNPA